MYDQVHNETTSDAENEERQNASMDAHNKHDQNN